MAETILLLPGLADEPFHYVGCGARGEGKNILVEALPAARYIGFEPDPDEHARLSATEGGRYTYLPHAVGGAAEKRTFRLTRNPACSSLFPPRREFLDRFLEMGPFFEVVKETEVETAALDDCLPQNSIGHVDFLELDVQGAELDILEGAEKMTAGGLAGVKAEVAFTPMYEGQPLFGDVDLWMREQGFMLFDLSRYRLRRKEYPRNWPTRGQLLWGHALYLRDFRQSPFRRHGTEKLAALASFLGFHDYALEAAAYWMQEGGASLTAEEKGASEAALQAYRASLPAGGAVKLMMALDASIFRGLLHRLGGMAGRLHSSYVFTTEKRKYFWKD